jgi:hypothetical protein
MNKTSDYVVHFMPLFVLCRETWSQSEAARELPVRPVTVMDPNKGFISSFLLRGHFIHLNVTPLTHTLIKPQVALTPKLQSASM